MNDIYQDLSNYFAQKGYGENEIPKMVRDTAHAIDLVLAKSKEKQGNELQRKGHDAIAKIAEIEGK